MITSFSSQWCVESTEQLLLNFQKSRRTTWKTTTQLKGDGLVYWKCCRHLSFFKENNGNVVTVDCECYIKITSLPLNYDENVCLYDIRVQQDGITAHTAKASMDTFCPLFNDHLFPDLLMFLGSLGPLICLGVIISFGETSRYVCMHISPVHWTTWRQLLMWTSLKLTEQCWMLKRMEANFQGHLQKCINENG